MKTKILSVIIANIIIIGFIIFTVFMQFGTNIKVLKKVEVCPIDVSYSQDARYNRFYGGGMESLMYQHVWLRLSLMLMRYILSG